MPRGNSLKFFLTAVVFFGNWASLYAQQNPLVIGYERFHSNEPSTEGGRILFNELGCANCHTPKTDLPQRKGPNLDGLLQHSDPDYIAAFLKDPTGTKPGTSMPQVQLREKEVEAVLHYLASLASDEKIKPAFQFVNAERGMALYHEMGCVACHEPSPTFISPQTRPRKDGSDYPSLPLLNLRQRYDIDALSAFLYEPHDFWKATRMPKFNLDREDGGDLAAHLLDFQNGNAKEYPPRPKFPVSESLAETGKVIVQARNCAACHDLGKQAQFHIPNRTPLTIAYTNDLKARNHPVYNLSKNQRQSINLFIKQEPKQSLPRIHMDTLNCVACHEHEGSGGPDAARKIYFTGNEDLGDSGLYPPPLTGIGKKLQQNWLKAVLDGENNIRPYLKTQMPQFGETTDKLIDLLYSEDTKPAEMEVPKTKLDSGKYLLGTQGGLNCITCHDWGDRKSLGIRALDISTMADRLQFEWLHDYLINPNQYRPNTLMPSFWPKGVASNQQTLEGDTKAQISAIYAFAKHGEDFPEGFPDQSSNEFEIQPTDRPVIQRTFMEGIGTHALLIGFPEGTHIALNMHSAQPALMWKGRFFDAYNTWFSRFPEFESPLGSDIVSWPRFKREPLAQYQGYRLDKDGVPEFRFTLNDGEVTERFTPQVLENGKVGMLRVVRYSRLSQLNDKRLTHPRKVKRTELKDSDPMARSFLYQW